MLPPYMPHQFGMPLSVYMKEDDRKSVPPTRRSRSMSTDSQVPVPVMRNMYPGYRRRSNSVQAGGFKKGKAVEGSKFAEMFSRSPSAVSSPPTHRQIRIQDPKSPSEASGSVPLTVGGANNRSIGFMDPPLHSTLPPNVSGKGKGRETLPTEESKTGSGPPQTQDIPKRRARSASEPGSLNDKVGFVGWVRKVVSPKAKGEGESP